MMKNHLIATVLTVSGLTLSASAADLDLMHKSQFTGSTVTAKVDRSIRTVKHDSPLGEQAAPATLLPENRAEVRQAVSERQQLIVRARAGAPQSERQRLIAAARAGGALTVAKSAARASQ